MITNKRKQGNEGEEIAANLLISKGYEIIERNYFCSNKGEIDIVAKDPGTGYTVFIEVKMRESLEYGEPEYSITSKKKAQMKRLAMLYLYEKEIDEVDCRFDVVAILKIPKQEIRIEHYVNAFD